VSAGNVLTLGRVHTRQRLIDKDVSGIKKGQPLTESELLIAGSNLYDHTGVFDWAEVDPKEPVTTQNTDDVLVKVHESNRNDFTYGFGFEVIERGGSIPSGTVALPNLPRNHFLWSARHSSIHAE
jgi:outer membrane protein assembly factor BamA